MGLGSSDWLSGILAAVALSALQFAGSQLQALIDAFGSSTEPDFGTIASSYNAMLAIALLLAGAMIACSLMERVLGGPLGAGWNVIPRTLMCVFFAFCGIQTVAYLAHYADLLGGTWTQSAQAQSDAKAVLTAWGVNSPATATTFVVKNAWNFIVLGLVAGLLSFFVYLELVVRGALILLVTLFIPLVAVMAIWPRLAGSALHLVEFLLGLLFSKFVLATAVNLGLGLLTVGLFVSHGRSPSESLATGIAILLIAAFSPVVLVQGLRFTHSTAGSVARGWVGSGVSMVPLAGALRAGRSLIKSPGVQRGRSSVVSAIRSRLPKSKKT